MLIDTLAEIHTIDYESVGLSDLGRPEGYTERQVERWGKQFDWAYETTETEREVPTSTRSPSGLRRTFPRSTSTRSSTATTSLTT